MAYRISPQNEAMDISDNQTYEQKSPFGDMMDMINEDAYEHDDDAFVDAPEHTDGMAGIMTNAGIGNQLQQVAEQDSTMDVDATVDHSARDFAHDELPGQQLQQQLEFSVNYAQNLNHDAKLTLKKEDIGDEHQLEGNHKPRRFGTSSDHGQVFDHASPTFANEAIDGDYNQESNHSLDYALGVPSNSVREVNLTASTLDSQTIVGDDQTVTSSHIAIKKPRYNPEDEPKETINIEKTTRRDDYAALYHATRVKKEPNQPSPPIQHSLDHMRGTNGTPQIKRSQSSTPEIKDVKDFKDEIKSREDFSDRILPNPDKDLFRAMQAHQRFHNRTVELKPSLELAPHRYWVAVLNPGVLPRNASKEDHYIWFKANRKTTIETVWKVYSNVTATLGFVFVMAGMRLEWEEQLEQLDLCNDKVIVLKVVEEGRGGCEGKAISEGLIKAETEVIELD